MDPLGSHCTLVLGVWAMSAPEEAKQAGAGKRCCFLTGAWLAPFLPGHEHGSSSCRGAGRRGPSASSCCEAPSEALVQVPRLTTRITCWFQ